MAAAVKSVTALAKARISAALFVVAAVNRVAGSSEANGQVRAQSVIVRIIQLGVRARVKGSTNIIGIRVVERIERARINIATDSIRVNVVVVIVETRIDVSAQLIRVRVVVSIGRANVLVSAQLIAVNVVCRVVGAAVNVSTDVVTVRVMLIVVGTRVIDVANVILVRITAVWARIVGETLVVAGDILHFAPYQFAQPDWGIAFDIDPAIAAATRKRFFDQMAADRVMFAGAHVPFPGFGHVARDGKAYRFTPADWQYAF